jgi:citrate lyase subunit beta/citryl-CoA lyase
LIFRGFRRSTALLTASGNATPRLMRSLLLVPPDNDARFDRALASGADAIVIDLADSPAAARPAHRRRVADFLRETRGPARLFVRIGPLSSAATVGDLDAVIGARPHGIVLIGAAGPADVARLSAMLRPHEAMAGIADGTTGIVPMTDTAAGLLALADYGRASARLVGLGWDAPAVSSALGARACRNANGNLSDAARLAQSLTLAAAAVTGVPAIDTPFDAAGNLSRLETEAQQARDNGFAGKFALDPGQVAAINRAFGPERRTAHPETVPILT